MPAKILQSKQRAKKTTQSRIRGYRNRNVNTIPRIAITLVPTKCSLHIAQEIYCIRRGLSPKNETRLILNEDIELHFE